MPLHTPASNRVNIGNCISPSTQIPGIDSQPTHWTSAALHLLNGRREGKGLVRVYLHYILALNSERRRYNSTISNIPIGPLNVFDLKRPDDE